MIATVIGLVGSAFAPNAVVAAFVALLGLGQGASFGLSVFLFTARAADGAGAAALSGFSQGTGYLVAAAGPLLIGYLHAISGGWALPVAALRGRADRLWPARWPGADLAGALR